MRILGRKPKGQAEFLEEFMINPVIKKVVGGKMRGATHTDFENYFYQRRNLAE